MNKDRSLVNVELVHKNSPIIKWCSKVGFYLRFLFGGIIAMQMYFLGWSALLPIVLTIIAYFASSVVFGFFIPDSVIEAELKDQEATIEKQSRSKAAVKMGEDFQKFIDIIGSDETSDFQKETAREGIREISKKFSKLQGVDIPTLHVVQESVNTASLPVTDKDGSTDFRFADGILCYNEVTGQFETYNFDKTYYEPDASFEGVDYVMHRTNLMAYENDRLVDQFVETVIYVRAKETV